MGSRVSKRILASSFNDECPGCKICPSPSPRRLQILGISENANCPVNNRLPQAGRMISFLESKSRWSEIPSKLRKPVLKGRYVSIAVLCPSPLEALSAVCTSIYFLSCSSLLAPVRSVPSAFRFGGGAAGHQLKSTSLFPLSVVGELWSQEREDARASLLSYRVCSCQESFQPWRLLCSGAITPSNCPPEAGQGGTSPGPLLPSAAEHRSRLMLSVLQTSERRQRLHHMQHPEL